MKVASGRGSAQLLCSSAVSSGQIPSMAIKASVCRVRKIARGTWGVVFTALALQIFLLALRPNVVLVL